ncbi:MAG: Asp-tRNA(Asn)/Glu-tRNA(Gln) amidotransferase subunit GatC [Gammaproteobacteria bacterium]|jgi:aspartyl-tRNA(Asn)/glutamyl-tRNA(Gln) amidotransferase subunit C|nr:Asp-tRNA(Asn)/Glu-tRNA(Gln) amidotransferase subunit GatC [Gammaproteobacteria bacterium]
MALDRSDVERLAHLARIGLQDADIPAHTAKLSSIMGLINKMQAVDTTGIQPLSHPLEATQRLRADQVTETDQREELQAIAPATEQGLYLVPRVIE